MTDENLAALKRLELIHEYIYNECEGNIFYPPEHNRVIFLRIKNAADMLLNKAVKILTFVPTILAPNNSKPNSLPPCVSNRTDNQLEGKPYEYVVTPFVMVPDTG